MGGKCEMGFESFGMRGVFFNGWRGVLWREREMEVLYVMVS